MKCFLIQTGIETGSLDNMAADNLPIEEAIELQDASEFFRCLKDDSWALFFIVMRCHFIFPFAAVNDFHQVFRLEIAS